MNFFPCFLAIFILLLSNNNKQCLPGKVWSDVFISIGTMYRFCVPFLCTVFMYYFYVLFYVPFLVKLTALRLCGKLFYLYIS